MIWGFYELASVEKAQTFKKASFFKDFSLITWGLKLIASLIFVSKALSVFTGEEQVPLISAPSEISIMIQGD